MCVCLNGNMRLCIINTYVYPQKYAGWRPRPRLVLFDRVEPTARDQDNLPRKQWKWQYNIGLLLNDFSVFLQCSIFQQIKLIDTNDSSPEAPCNLIYHHVTYPSNMQNAICLPSPPAQTRWNQCWTWARQSCTVKLRRKVRARYQHSANLPLTFETWSFEIVKTSIWEGAR